MSNGRISSFFQFSLIVVTGFFSIFDSATSIIAALGLSFSLLGKLNYSLNTKMMPITLLITAQILKQK